MTSSQARLLPTPTCTRVKKHVITAATGVQNGEPRTRWCYEQTLHERVGGRVGVGSL